MKAIQNKGKTGRGHRMRCASSVSAAASYTLKAREQARFGVGDYGWQVTDAGKPTPWIAVYYRDTDNPAHSKLTEEAVASGGLVDPAPARAFLRSIPTAPRAALYATIVVVRDYPPLQFPTSGQTWCLMHKSPKKGK